PIAARITPLAEVAKQPHGGIAPRIPALEEIWLIGVKDTLSKVTAPSAPGKGGGAEIALDCAQTEPDLRMQRLPTGLALRGTLLRGLGNVVGWHGHGQRSIRQRHGLLVPQGIDCIKRLAVREEHLVQSLPEILE